MAVYMFTFHAYRSWMPDRAQGYVRKGEVLPTNEEEAQRYARRARNPQITFDRTIQETLVKNARIVCDENKWRLHQARATPTHMHVLVSWQGFFEWKEISNKLKRRLGSGLSKALGRKGPWFSRGSSRKQVRDRGHFDYLMNEYLPKHGCTFWREDEQ